MEDALKEFNPQAAVVVPSRNAPRDFMLLLRLLTSLMESDFPREYTLITVFSGSVDGRIKGIQQALGYDYILVTDNDCAVPTKWYDEAVRVVDREGYAAPLIGGNLDGFVLFSRGFLTEKGVTNSSFAGCTANLNVIIRHDKEVEMFIPDKQLEEVKRLVQQFGKRH